MNFRDLVNSAILNFIRPLIWLILSAAIVFFLWNILQIIRKSDQPEELAKLKTHATWGIIAIFVMTSLWGLVNILINTVGSGTLSTPPTIMMLGPSGGNF